jgi:hypothetical protein
LTYRSAEFRKVAVGFFARTLGRASISSAEPNNAGGFRDDPGHLAPIANRESSFVGAKVEKQVRNRGQFVTLAAKKVVNRPIMVRFLAQARRSRDSSAKAGPSQS